MDGTLAAGIQIITTMYNGLPHAQWSSSVGGVASSTLDVCACGYARLIQVHIMHATLHAKSTVIDQAFY